MATVIEARKIRNGWGCNIPFDGSNSDNIAQALSYLGTRWVRFQFSGNNSSALQGIQNALVANNVPDPNLKLQLLLNGYIANANTNTLANQQSWILNNVLPINGANGNTILKCVEGPNEMNNVNVGQGSRGPNDQTNKTGNGDLSSNSSIANANLVDWATQVATFKANNSVLSGVEIISGTVVYFYQGDWPPSELNVTNYTDFATEHYYAGATGTTGVPSYPPNPGNFTHRYSSAQAGLSPGRSLVQSEGGASTESGTGGYTDFAAAVYQIMAILDFFAVGGHRSMIYTLFNNTNSTNNSTRTNYNEDNFGLFWGDLTTPKLPAIALSNMQDLLSLGLNKNDSRNFSDTANFAYGYDSTNFSVTGLNNAGTSGSTLIMPKSDGSTLIAVWCEPPIVNQGANVAATANPITINFGSNQHYKIYDPMGNNNGTDYSVNKSVTPIASGTGSSASTTLFATPLFIELAKPVSNTRSNINVFVVE